MIPVFGDPNPPPLWSVVMWIAIGIGIIAAGSIALGAILIGMILLMSAPRLWRKDEWK